MTKFILELKETRSVDACNERGHCSTEQWQNALFAVQDQGVIGKSYASA